MLEEKFWQWFEKHQSEYCCLDDLSEQKKELLLDEFLRQLHEYNSGLYFQIGGDYLIEKKELIISAEGKIELFNAVEKLVNAAPKFNNWEIIALKQPRESNFITKYKGIVLDPKTMWFLPLNNEKNPGMIGIRICLNNFNSLELNNYKLAVYQVLDSILGEKSTAMDIDYLDIDDLSNYDIEAGVLIELLELPDYINWKKGKIKK